MQSRIKDVNFVSSSQLPIITAQPPYSTICQGVRKTSFHNFSSNLQLNNKNIYLMKKINKANPNNYMSICWSPEKPVKVFNNFVINMSPQKQGKLLVSVVNKSRGSQDTKNGLNGFSTRSISVKEVRKNIAKSVKRENKEENKNDSNSQSVEEVSFISYFMIIILKKNAN